MWLKNILKDAITVYQDLCVRVATFCETRKNQKLAQTKETKSMVGYRQLRWSKQSIGIKFDPSLNRSFNVSNLKKVASSINSKRVLVSNLEKKKETETKF